MVAFFTYNIVGCFLWIFLFTLVGYFSATIPLVKTNFTLVIIIILVGIAPAHPDRIVPSEKAFKKVTRLMTRLKSANRPVQS